MRRKLEWFGCGELACLALGFIMTSTTDKVFSLSLSRDNETANRKREDISTKIALCGVLNTKRVHVQKWAVFDFCSDFASRFGDWMLLWPQIFVRLFLVVAFAPLLLYYYMYTLLELVCPFSENLIVEKVNRSSPVR